MWYTRIYGAVRYQRPRKRNRTGRPPMITLFLVGLASVAVGPLLALAMDSRTSHEPASAEAISAGMFVALNDNAALAAKRAA